MAWNIHWQIPFKSFLGTSYNLNILEQDYSGSVVTLTGAKNPFETQEENSDDVFKPIRGQSGKINIMTNDADLLPSIMPANNLARRVELRVGGTNVLQWRGFIPANAYSQPEDNSYYTVTIPVKSVLSSLSNVDFTGYYGSFLTIGDAINICFQKIGITLGTDGNMYFLTELEDFTDYLHTVICASVFYGSKTIVNTDTPVQTVTASSCMDVIEELLRPLGLTIYEMGSNFYVVSNAKLHDSSSVVHFKLYDFTTKQAGGISTYGKVTINSLNSTIASDNQKVSFSPGAKSVAVNFGLNDSAVIDSGDPSTPYSTNQLYGGTKLRDGEADGVIYGQLVNAPSTPRRDLWTEQFYQRSQEFYKRLTSGQKWFNESSATESGVMSESAFAMDTIGHKTDTPEMIGQGGTLGAILCRYGEGESLNDLTLEPGLLINMNSAYGMALYYGVDSGELHTSDLVYSLTSNNVHTFKSGYIHLDLEYKVIEYYQRGFIDSDGPNIKVFIGNTEIEPSGNTGYHITTEMTGALSIRIYGGDRYAGVAFPDPRTIIIKKLRLYWSIRADEVTASQEDENVYMMLLNRNFTDTKEISTTLGSDNNNKASTSIFYNANMESITSYQIYDGSPLHLYRPEMYLLNLMQSQYNRTQRTLTRTYRRLWSYNPGIPFTKDGMNFIAIRDKIKWVDDEVTVKFIQTYLTA